MADDTQTPNTNNQVFTVDHLFQLTRQFKNTPLPPPPPTPPPPPATKIKEAYKLTYNNYVKWCRLISLTIEGQGRLRHITAPPLNSSDPTTGLRGAFLAHH